MSRDLRRRVAVLERYVEALLAAAQRQIEINQKTIGVIRSHSERLSLIEEIVINHGQALVEQCGAVSELFNNVAIARTETAQLAQSLGFTVQVVAPDQASGGA